MHRKTVIDFRALGERYTFTQPIKELKTRDLAEVADLLAQVESYQEQGYYVVGYVSYEAAPAFEEKLAVHKAPLLGEYLLYFTVHDRVETSPIPLTYEAVSYTHLIKYEGKRHSKRNKPDCRRCVRKGQFEARIYLCFGSFF